MHLPGARIHYRHGLTAIVDEQLLAGATHLAHRHVDLPLLEVLLAQRRRRRPLGKSLPGAISGLIG